MYQAQADLLAPLRAFAATATSVLRHPLAQAVAPYGAPRLAAAYEMLSHAGLTHTRPAFGIATVTVGEGEARVVEEVADATPFATLLRFRTAPAGPRTRVLVVAPMSGHFATLLRDTVRTLVAEHDVYLTDWHNARDVAPEHGPFGLDEYAEHVMRFVRAIGPGAHVVAVCQPCVPVLAAAAILAEDDDPAQPRSMTLMAGPVDVSASPTQVNELARAHPLAWFERTLISRVPARYPGAGRPVYPGFVQLSAFVSMNPERHLRAQRELYESLIAGETAKATAVRDFYDEYFAVADLPAEFYLETLDRIFQQNALANGTLRWRGRLVRPAAIRRTALLTVEGERDDVCGLGQTAAAQGLCSGLPAFRKRHHLQAGVGHYGVFSGGRWRRQIYPAVRNLIVANE